MSWQPAEDPTCPAPPSGVELVLLPRAHDIGGFEVRRALPARERQMVGPFIFFDQMGPGEFLAGRGLDVRPHPHIGLSTVTYLFDGEILHRDSLGSRAADLPGRRELDDRRAAASPIPSAPTRRCAATRNRLFGIQSWVALPKAAEETAPAFVHHPAASLPLVEDGGVRLRLIAGDGLGAALRRSRSPRRCSTPMRSWRPARPCRCPTSTRSARPTCWRARSRSRATASSPAACWSSAPGTGWRCAPGRRERGVLLLGGAAMDGPRYLFWNFVSSSPRADRAGQGGLEGRALRQGARRRGGVHPAAGGARLGARRRRSG